MRIHLFGLTTLGLMIGALQAPAQNEKDHSASPVEQRWIDLADGDAVKAYRALWELVQVPADAVSRLAKSLKPAAAPEPAAVERLLDELNSDKFTVRDKAFVELGNLGALVEPALRKSIEANPPLEKRQRIVKLLEKLAGPVTLPAELRQTRAVELLEQLRTPDAKALLGQYAAGTPAARLTQEARAALERLAASPGPVTAPKLAAVDLFGDPLPSGATGRLGSVRFRRDLPGLSAFAFLPDGKSLLTAGVDHQVQVWDIATGRLTRQIRTGPENPGRFSLSGFALAPDARHIAMVLSHPPVDNQAGRPECRVFAFPSGELVRAFPRERFDYWTMEFSPDGKLLFSIGRREAVLRVDNIETGEEVAQRTFPGGAGVGLAISRDCQTVAIASGPLNRHLFLWKWRDKDEPRQLPVKGYGLERARFSTDDRLLAGVDTLRKLLVWEVATGRLLYSQEAPEKGHHYLRRPTFTPDGKTMAVDFHSNHGVGPGKTHLLDPATGQSQGILAGGGDIAISPDSRTLAVAVGTGTRLFDLATRMELGKRADGHDWPPTLLAASSNDFLVTAGDNGTVRFWDATTMTLRRKWESEHSISALALSPDGRLLATSSLEDSVRVWDVPADKELYRLPGHGQFGGRRTLGFRSDGQLLLSFGDDFDLRGWDMSNGKAQFEHSIRPDDIVLPNPDDERSRRERLLLLVSHAAGFTPDGAALVVDWNGSIFLFDARTGKQVAKYGSEKTIQSSLAISPNGKLLLSSAYGASRSGQHILSLLEPASGRLVQRLVLPGQRDGPVAFSPDGRMFATALDEPEREIRVYEKATGNVRGILRGFRGHVRALAFMPDNRRLASSLSDATVVLWDLASVLPAERK